jgi:hypothetical protein
MDISEARRAISSLRMGIPPEGFIRYFTVGRVTEIEQLANHLARTKSKALLLKANYGSGKTHLLRYIRELALEEGFAVSTITLDAKAAVSFNRMDQVFGAVLRNIELPNRKEKGPAALFGAILRSMNSPCNDPDRKRQLDAVATTWYFDLEPFRKHGNEDFLKMFQNTSSFVKSQNGVLNSYPLFLGLRAWIAGKSRPALFPGLYEQVEAWLCESWQPVYTKTWLKQRFVTALKRPNSRYQFEPDSKEQYSLRFADGIYARIALAELNKLAVLAGYKGLVLLVDEFEDVLYNLSRIDYKLDALINLFKIAKGEYPGPSFYAVTPGFVTKCKEILLNKGYALEGTPFDYNQLDSFEMSPLGIKELDALAWKIVGVHGIAYSWAAPQVVKVNDLNQAINILAKIRSEDRARYIIKEVIKILDHKQEELA